MRGWGLLRSDSGSTRRDPSSGRRACPEVIELNDRHGQRARDLLLDTKDQWITQGVYSFKPVKKTEIKVTHNFFRVSKTLVVPIGFDLVIESNFSQGNAKLVNRTDTYSKQLNIVFAAEITGHDAGLVVKGIGRKTPKPPQMSAPTSPLAKRVKIGVKSELEAQAAYKPPPPRAARG